MWEKSACLADVSVTSRFYEILRELSMCKQCVPGFFSLPMHKSMGTRLTHSLDSVNS